MLSVSTEIPDIVFGQLQGDDIIELKARELFADGLYVVVGLPGVFTPICTHDHIPSLIKSVNDIKASGVKEIYVISDDNVWAIDAWKRTLSDHEDLVFLSDGNRDFLKHAKLPCSERNLFLEGHYGRFYAIVENNVIRRVRAETTVLKTVCTDGRSILADISDAVHQASMRA